MRSRGFLSVRRGAGELDGHCVGKEQGAQSGRGKGMRSKGQYQLDSPGTWRLSFAIRYRHGSHLRLAA